MKLQATLLIKTLLEDPILHRVDYYYDFDYLFCSFNLATWGHSPWDIEHVKNVCNINKAKYVQEETWK